MLKHSMRRGIHIAVTLLAIVAAACCLKGNCHPGANADDCCRNTAPDATRLLAPIVASHQPVTSLVSSIAIRVALFPPPVFHRLTHQFTHSPPQAFHAAVNLPLLV
jgi:hypothetical protein